MTDNWIGLLEKSLKEAARRGIEANSIVINENMVVVPSFFVRHYDTGKDRCTLHEMPRMICGLNVVLTKDELPDGYSFAVVEAPDHRIDRLKEFESIGMEPAELRKAAEIYRTIKETMKGEDDDGI